MSAHRRPARVVMMAWDGMRPDLVSPGLTPNLAALAAAGAVFDAAHAVVPTVTRVNAATLATGAAPGVHGLPANLIFAPEVDPTGPISLGEGENVAALRAAYGVFAAPTMADVIHAAGGRTVVVSSGTRGCAQMLHPRRREVCDLILHPTLSSEAELAAVVERLGPLPPADVPDTARNHWLTRAIAEIVLPEHRPDLLMFWHDDPDKTQHKYGFGHPRSLEAIRAADAHLGLVLRALDETGLRAETLVVVVSDHGYVHARERLDLVAALAQATDLGRVVVAPNGCSALVYSEDRSHLALARLAGRIARAPGVGVLFSGANGAPVVEGTAPLALLNLGGPLVPDLLVTFDWSDDPNEFGHAGVSAVHGTSTQANHGGASAWEIRNTLILSGPGVRTGARIATPAGHGDLAPTILTALGLPVPESMTGRVLAESHDDPRAWGAASAPVPCPESGRRTDRFDGPTGAVELAWSTYGEHAYLDAARRVR